MLFGCGHNDNLKETYYGGELYNAVYGEAGDNITHIIPLMSKKDMTNVTDIQVESEGGSFDLNYSIEDGEYSYKNYKLYRVCLDFSQITFDQDYIDIKKLIICYEDSKDEIALDRCQLVKIEGEYNNEYIDLNGTPIKVPQDMTSLPLEISTESKITIDNIYLTNDCLQVADDDGNATDAFEPISISKNDDIVTYNLKFKVSDTSELAQYKNIGTTMVVEYTYENQKYYTVSAIPRTIYNPFDSGYDGIDHYFSYLTK
jgi:hypothetical protein